jgi:hypothetical protein
MSELVVHIFQSFDPPSELGEAWTSPIVLCGSWEALANAPVRHHSLEAAGERSREKKPF